MDIRSFIAGARYEWIALRRESATWIALAACVGLIFFALHGGARRVETQTAAVAAAYQDEAQRLKSLRATLADLEKGAGPKALPPYRDPRNAVFVGGGLAATVAALNPAPLALAAVGQSDLYPPALKVTSDSKDSFLYVDEIENPAHLAAGAIDLAFLLIFVYPLWLLALVYNLVGGERERGTLSLTLASAASPGAALAGKFAARALPPIFATMAAIFAGVALFRGLDAASSREGLALLAFAALYGVFWAGLAAAIDLRATGGSAQNALLAVGVWLLLTLIAPSAVNSLAQTVFPSPSRLDMILAARAAATDADKARDATLARYQEEHQGAAEMARGDARERTLRRLAVQQAAYERVEAVLSAHDAQLSRQQQFVDRLSFLSPPLLMYRAVVELAGAGEARYRAFLARVDAFHAEWRGFFVAKARAGEALRTADYVRFPKFNGYDAEAASGAATLAGLAAGLALWTLAFAAAAGVALRRLQR